MTQNMVPVCSDCGSDRIYSDAWAEWDLDNQQWALRATFDRVHCEACDVADPTGATSQADIEWIPLRYRKIGNTHYLGKYVIAARKGVDIPS